MGLDLHALALGARRGGVEDEVDVLAGADLVLDVGGHVELLAAYPPARNRFVGADEVEPGAGQLGQFQRLPHGLAGGLRTIRSNHNASEHARPLLLGP